jgi:hypothetical protein
MSNGATITAISDVLKFRYLGPVQAQLNDEVLITQILNLDSKNIDLDGLKAVVPLRYGRNGGHGARRENGTLPSAGAQKYKTANFDLKYQYGTAQFSGPAIQKTKTDMGSFVRVITSELDGLRRDLAMDMARQFYGPGTGVVATVASVAGSVITLTASDALDKGFIALGSLLDVATGVTPASFKTQGASVTDLDPSVPSITVDVIGTSAAADNLFIAGTVDAAGTMEVDAGLQALISTTANTIGGLDSTQAGLKWWKPQFDTSGGAIGLDNLMSNWNKATNAGLKSDEAVVLTTPGLARRLFATTDFKSNVRFVDTQALKGGFESIGFSVGNGKVTMVTDRQAPNGKVHFIDKDAIQVYSPGDWDYISRDGLTIRQVSNQDAFQAFLYRYVNLGTNQRNTSLVMSGLTDTGF